MNKFAIHGFWFAIIFQLSLWPFASADKAYCGQDDLFYESFLRQRMMTAKIREFRGDAAAKSLLKELVEEGKRSGMKLPEWAHPKRGRVQITLSAFRRSMDSKKYDSLVLQASKTYGLKPALIKAVIRAESAFVEQAISNKGAQGLMQLMPETAKDLKVANAFDPKANIFGGTRLLRQHIDEFGSLKKALVAYNAGGNVVRKGKRVPKESRDYVKKVIHYYRMFRQ